MTAGDFSDPGQAQNPLKLVGRAYRGFARLADTELRGLGMSLGQLKVLVWLKHRKALSQAELARIAQVEQPSMAQLLNRMERDGWVERLADPADRRSRLISLTPLAARRLPKARALLDARVEQALGGFAPAEVEQMTALLLRLVEQLDRLAGEAEAG